ncbi:uncharacterized protein PHACADRAFT_248789 [Phanerochaete carnosa HHB-10118-sp]|uniref:Uncharacterized protein n=1 Tax=Phanerochaete carnosa (strain HHB-10118-sp) TaxID=650164 RepID=K5VFU5_PHACS|nr:uncharacterized protein PHACADRAFT_248789 [Phanerochaete carnosa HHB-10118-sp]EKM61886.1 hypothetical protein PHACADRAFT_248789 [Phanerochaete carnosa HHB-10118-sp]
MPQGYDPWARRYDPFAVELDASGPELERMPPRVAPKHKTAIRRSLPMQYGIIKCEHLPTSWHGTFDLFTIDPGNTVLDDLDVLQWSLEGEDALDTMRLSLGWDTDLLSPEEALDTASDNVPMVGVLSGSPLSVGNIKDMLRTCGVENPEETILPWSQGAWDTDSVPLIVIHGRVEPAAFRTPPLYEWFIDNGYVAKLRFVAKSDQLCTNDQVVILGEGGIKLRKIWQHEDMDCEDGPRLRELFVGHFEFTVSVTNVLVPQNLVVKTLRRDVYGIRSKRSMDYEHPAYLGLPRLALQSILIPPYNGPVSDVPTPSTLTPTPDAALPPLDFTGHFWFASPDNLGLLLGYDCAVKPLRDAYMPKAALNAWRNREDCNYPKIPLEAIPPDADKLESAYEHIHAHLMWTIDNSGLRWLDGHAVLAEGARDTAPVDGVGVGIRGRFGLAVDENSRVPPTLHALLYAGVEVTGGHVGPVHFPVHTRVGYRKTHRRGWEVQDSQPEHRWEHGLWARLRLPPAHTEDDGERKGESRLTCGEGILKMRRVWAYALPANDRHGALTGELFEGWYKFMAFDAESGTYKKTSDTFFAVRWRDREQREGKRDLAEQRMPSQTRVNRWRTDVTGPFDCSGWSPDEAPPTFFCHQDQKKEANWSLNEPPPSMKNFVKWMKAGTGKNKQLNWKNPPQPDPKTSKTKKKAKLVVRTPSPEPASSADGSAEVAW